MSRYRFITIERAHYPVRQLCTVLQVSASGFYDWLKRTPSRRAQTNNVSMAALSDRIRQAHARSRQTYGYLWVHAELRANGEWVSKHRIVRLMRQMALQIRGQRRFRVTTQPNVQHRRAPNRLRGDFSATQPNQKWVADVTFTPPLRKTGSTWQLSRILSRAGSSAGRWANV